MIHIMIVEDNKMFRFALKTMIDWENSEFVMASEAINGKHALELLNTVPVDIIITDISMPEMNGIELIKQVRVRYPKIKIIVLSHYDDFEFVKDALKFGAEDYLLKHDIESEDIMKMLASLKNKIYNQRKKRTERIFVKNKQAVEVDNFAVRLINGHFHSIDEIKTNMEMIGITFDVSSVVLLLTDIETSCNKKESSSDDLRKAIHAIVNTEQYRGFVASIQKDKLLVTADVKNVCSQYKIKQNIYKIASDILSYANKNGYDVTIGISQICSDIMKAPLFYRQCEMAIQEVFYEDEKMIIQYDLTIGADTYKDLEVVNAKRIKGPMINKNINQIKTDIGRLFDGLYKVRLDKNSLKIVMIELSAAILEFSRYVKVDIYDIIGKDKNIVDMVKEKKRIAEKKEFFLEIVEKIFEKSNAYQRVENPEIRKIIEYIEKNYMHPLSLTAIAEKYNYSPNYLCNLFRQETGETLNKFIKYVRIEKAKYLLHETGLKTYEIAEKTGFKNVSYFCTVFKEITGISSKNYKAKGDAPV